MVTSAMLKTRHERASLETSLSNDGILAENTDVVIVEEDVANLLVSISVDQRDVMW